MNATATAVKAEAAIRLCFCGCETEIGKKSTFAPGHDARYVGAEARYLVVDGNYEGDIQHAIDVRTKQISEATSEALGTKFYNAAMNAWHRVATKDAKPARQPRATTSLKGKAVTVKVGRWTKPGTIEAVAGGKPAVISYTDSKGQTVKINVTAKTEWSLAG